MYAWQGSCICTRILYSHHPPPARTRSVAALFWQGFFAPPRHRPPIQPIQLATIVRPYTRVCATVQETRVLDTCVRNGAVNRVRYYVCGSKNTIYRHDRENSRRAPPVQSITTELCRQDVPILSCPPLPYVVRQRPVFFNEC